MMLLSSVVFAAHDDVILLKSELPVVDTLFLNVSIVPNSTVFVDVINNPFFVNVSFPLASITNFSSFAIPFTYNVSDTIFVSDFNETFNATITAGNVSANYSILFRFMNDIPYSNDGFFVTVQNGSGFFVEVTTNLLPKEKDFSIEVNGLSGERINMTCDHWLTCDGAVEFGSDDKARVTIGLLIPQDVDIGNYTQEVRFVGVNNTATARINIRVKESKFIYSPFVADIDCTIYHPNGSTRGWEWNCIQEFMDYEYQKQSALFQFYQDSLQCTKCTNETIIEYVLSGDVSEDIKFAYDSCKEDRDEARSSYNDCTTDLTSYTGLHDTCTWELSSARTVALETTAADKIACIGAVQDGVDKCQDKNKRATWRVIFIILGVIIILIIILLVNHSNKYSTRL